MSVRLVVDMNLSVEWITELTRHGWSAIHWSTVGDPRADDITIMAWAVENGDVVFTHDLDFGTTLALTHATGPSVLQVRGQNVLPEHLGPLGRRCPASARCRIGRGRLGCGGREQI